jgi:hypothetical protein
MARVYVRASILHMGRIRCVCGSAFHFPQPIALYVLMTEERGVVVDARTLAKLHRCGVRRIWWCESCREEAKQPRFTMRGRRRHYTNRCATCRLPLSQREV